MAKSAALAAQRLFGVRVFKEIVCVHPGDKHI